MTSLSEEPSIISLNNKYVVPHDYQDEAVFFSTCVKEDLGGSQPKTDYNFTY